MRKGQVCIGARESGELRAGSLCAEMGVQVLLHTVWMENVVDYRYMYSLQSESSNSLCKGEDGIERCGFLSVTEVGWRMDMPP